MNLRATLALLLIVGTTVALSYLIYQNGQERALEAHETETTYKEEGAPSPASRFPIVPAVLGSLLAVIGGVVSYSVLQKSK